MYDKGWKTIHKLKLWALAFYILHKAYASKIEGILYYDYGRVMIFLLYSIST